MKLFKMEPFTEVSLICNSGYSMSKKNEIQDELELANTLYLTGKLNSAGDIYARLGSKCPEATARALLSLGDILEEEGKLDEALVAFTRATKVDPRFADAWCNLGNVQAELGYDKKALKSYRKAIDIDKNCKYSLNNLGNLLSEQGDGDAAINCFKRAIKVDDKFGDAYYNLGNLYRERDQREEAIECYKKSIELDPDDNLAPHLLAAMEGRTTDKAPEEYVESLFDEYSGRFDEELVEELGYNIPAKLFKAFGQVCDKKTFEHTADLGCGTGLSGQKFRGVSKKLTGIDLSRHMLNAAKEKGIYDKLHKGEISEFLSQAIDQFDLIIATDVFIYLGDLDKVFAAAQHAAIKGAYFIFSVESCRKDGYLLLKSGRYAHSKKYIASLAEKYGFSIKLKKKAKIRKEEADWVKGKLYVLEQIEQRKN